MWLSLAADPRDEHHHDPIALEQNRLSAEEIDAPQAVPGVPYSRKPGRAAAVGSRSRVPNQNTPDDVLVEFDTESA